VPQVGGRVLDYSLDSYNFLFLGRREVGTTLEDGGDERYRHFGGHFAQLHPEAQWQSVRSRYPPELFMGRYEATIEDAAGSVAAVELTSPADLATGTRLVRRIELFPGSSHLRITDTLTNVRRVAQEWGLHDFVQLKGCPVRNGILRGDETPNGQIGLYVPLNPDSEFPGGVRRILPDPRVGRRSDDPWSTSRLPGLLTLRYRRQFSKVLVDPDLPWIAFVDHGEGYVFVQQCPAPQKAILTAGPPLDAYPFIELQSYGPVVRLEPGQSTSLVQDWYAARCPGPVVDVTDAGAVASPLSLLRDGAETWLAGTFGVFHVGTAAVVLRGVDGSEIARLPCGEVGPSQVFRLHCPVRLPPGTAEIALEVLDLAGQRLGDLGTILLPAR
jgi:hypothetical protein